MKYLYIQKLPRGGYGIYIDIQGTCSREGSRYYGYSKRDAIRAFRRDFGVVGQHFTIIEY